tara:strand:+ start:880 stop:1158 length:279 start_codon:yes stop_codon:yes gene_type:complete
MQIILKGHIIVPDGDLPAVSAALVEHIRLTREEPGCLCFEVNVDQDNPNRYNVYEEFQDRSTFEQHQQRVAASDWGAVTQNVSRHYEIEERD